jgi:hypothetical protein
MEELLASDPVLPDQMQQRFFNWDVKQLFQFGGEQASRSLIDKSFRCVQQSTVARKPNRVKCPKAILIEVGDIVEGVKPATV